MNPVCFHIGSHPIYWYGVLMALAFLAGISHWQWLGRRTGRDVSLAGDLAFWLMIGGIIGARIA
jgi:phosphatidylglycerol:prolipoprotein diacylglycerol transferase